MTRCLYIKILQVKVLIKQVCKYGFLLTLSGMGGRGQMAFMVRLMLGATNSYSIQYEIHIFNEKKAMLTSYLQECTASEPSCLTSFINTSLSDKFGARIS